jgi:hypothetical protein
VRGGRMPVRAQRRGESATRGGAARPDLKLETGRGGLGGHARPLEHGTANDEGKAPPQHPAQLSSLALSRARWRHSTLSCKPEFAAHRLLRVFLDRKRLISSSDSEHNPTIPKTTYPVFRFQTPYKTLYSTMNLVVAIAKLPRRSSTSRSPRAVWCAGLALVE